MLNPQEYVLKQVHDYPTLYANKDFSHSRRAVFNQLFNVIGNGIRNEYELFQAVNQELDPTVDYNRYTTGEPLYLGYTKMKAHHPGFEFPDLQYRISGAYYESEKEHVGNLLGVIHWTDLYAPRKNVRSSAFEPKVPYQWSPYPNFKPEYSIVWDDCYAKLGVPWIEAALEFYHECKEYFKGDCSNYSYAYPCRNEIETANRDYDLSQYLATYTDFSAISEAYGVEYRGNIQEFQTARWLKEKERILTFLDETIMHLEAMKHRLLNDSSYQP